jgi:hypothetical protein
VWKSVKALQEQTGCQVYGNATAWWNADISIRFLRFHFDDRDDMTKTILLLWDDFSGHWTPQVVAYADSINVVLMKVPPRYTYVCQSADVAWNKPYKDKLRGLWVERLQSQISDHHAAEQVQNKRDTGEEETTSPAAFRLTPPSRNDIIAWIAAS